MDEIIRVTAHAKKRAMKRYAMTEEKVKEFAYKAVTEGYSAEDAPSPKIRKYLKSKIKKKRKLYVYSGYVFVFDVGNYRMHLVTSFRIPKYYLNTIK